MKRFLKVITMFLLMLGIFFMAGCSDQKKPINFKQTDTFKTLIEVDYPDSEAKIEEAASDIVSAIQKFSAKTIKELFSEKEKNYIYSPLSLYFALSMLLEGVSTDDAKLELENLLGLERETNRVSLKTVYENNFYKNNKGILRLANSIWFKNNFPIEQEYLQVLADNFYAESYQTDFDDEGHQNIVDWINYYTENFLELTKDKFPVQRNTIILLLNTIYFENKWKIPFDEYLTKENDFYTSSGKVKAEFMTRSAGSKYKAYDKYQVAEDYFENDASITYILPNEGLNVFDLLSKEVLANALNPENKEITRVCFTVPKFKYFSNFALNDSLQKLGVNEVFSQTSNCLELMSKGGGLFVSHVKQNAGIEFSEAGVKAAAVTSISTVTSAFEELPFVLNRPFIYIIKDAYGIPLFIGLLQNPVTS